MPPERQRLIRLLFDEYIELYAARDARLVTRFSDNFSGFAGSSDQLITSRADWVAITQQDFAQVPGRIGIELVDLFPQDLGEDVVAVTAFFHIHLPMPDPLFARETARLVLVFRREGDDWKIAHSSISMPFGLARAGGEVYSVDHLQQRNQMLQTLVEEQTTALAEARHQLQQLGHTDGLTGVANRRHFDQALAHEWGSAQRAHAPLALILLDVDLFKHFNDHYGHLAGDASLQALALTLAQTGGRREGHLVARWSGEKFAVLMPGLDAAGALAVAQQIQQAVQALALPHEGAPLGTLTASLGVVSLVPQRDQLCEELVRLADRATYRAKQGGRNRIELAAV